MEKLVYNMKTIQQVSGVHKYYSSLDSDKVWNVLSKNYFANLGCSILTYIGSRIRIAIENDIFCVEHPCVHRYSSY